MNVYKIKNKVKTFLNEKVNIKKCVFHLNQALYFKTQWKKIIRKYITMVLFEKVFKKNYSIDKYDPMKI